MRFVNISPSPLVYSVHSTSEWFYFIVFPVRFYCNPNEIWSLIPTWWILSQSSTYLYRVESKNVLFQLMFYTPNANEIWSLISFCWPRHILFYCGELINLFVLNWFHEQLFCFRVTEKWIIWTVGPFLLGVEWNNCMLLFRLRMNVLFFYLFCCFVEIFSMSNI